MRNKRAKKRRIESLRTARIDPKIPIAANNAPD